MENKILISVIVPVFNTEKYVGKCLESILHQTYENIEVIVIDDGSTDESGKICDYYAKCDERIVVIHKKNCGLVSARKSGALAAHGDYIINVDSDDWIGPARVESLIKALNNNPDMVYLSGYYRVYNDYIVKQERDIKNEEYFGDDICNVFLKKIVDGNVFFKRTIEPSQCMWAIERNLYLRIQSNVPEDAAFGEDHLCVFPAILHSNKIVCIEESSYYYVVSREASIAKSSSLKKKRLDIYFRSMLELVSNNKQDKYLENVVAHFLFYALMCSGYDERWFVNGDELYPYEGVKHGDRIIVYGAGKVGTNIKNYLMNSEKYKYVATVDTKCIREGILTEIKDIEEEFDCILVAVLENDFANEIVQTLLASGIPHHIIKVMNPQLVKLENISDDILSYL